ncbi:MAG: SDR family oxidoreductase [Chitinophagales bacterium]|nr:SDR family oxidoreductase [Chitinophagales bacterium]
MNGKTAIITGANSGLGFETSLKLASNNSAVIMVCRSEKKGKAAMESIIEKSGNDHVTLEIADLASQSEVRALAGRIQSAYDKVDVLVNNAGLIMSDHKYTVDGIETTFAVNHLAPFLLTRNLLPLLSEAEDARIVNVSSNNHFKADINFEDIHHQENFSGLKAYGQSKLANVLFTYELNRRLKRNGLNHISINALDPGLINTDIGNKKTGWLYSIAWHIRKRQGISPEKGSRTQVYLASSDEVRSLTGKYWRNSKAFPSSKASYNTQHAEQLWELSMDLCGLDNYINRVRTSYVR